MRTQLEILSLLLLCLSATVQPVALSSSVEEGEEEALKLWQKFCAGTTEDKGSNSGGLFVFCSPTPLNDEVPAIDLRLNHDIKVSQEEKRVQTEVETVKPTSSTEIPIARSVSRHANGTRGRGRGGRRRLYFAKKNTIEKQTKDEQFTRALPSASENPSESSTQISVSSPQNETQTVSEVNEKNSRVSVIRKAKKKDESESRRNVHRSRSAGRRRVAVLDVKPVSLFVSNETSTTQPNENSN